MKNISLPLLLIALFLANTIQAQVASSLLISDTRSVNDLPNASYNGIKADFKRREIIGVPGQGVWSTNLTFSQWTSTDNTGDKNHQLNFNNGGIFYRNAFPLDSQWGTWRQILMENESGNVGIGTLDPTTKLDVIGTIKSYESTPLSATTNSFQLINEIGGSTGSSNKMMNKKWLLRDATSDNWWTARLHDGISVDASYMNPHVDTKTWWERDPNDNIQSWGNAAETYLTINKGNVGIGTTNPTAKLTVAGDINSREVRVTVSAGADFVFENNYNLPSLTSVETFIKENKHLPEIASAKEMQENGINLSEMNIKLLQKIEELTLYTIEQEKKNIEQSKEIDKANKEIETLKKENEGFKSLSERLSKIENQLKK